MSTPEKPDGPEEFMDLDEITEQQMLKALREMKPHKPGAKEPVEPMQLDDIAEDGLLKMLRERKAVREANPTPAKPTDGSRDD